MRRRVSDIAPCELRCRCPLLRCVDLDQFVDPFEYGDGQGLEIKTRADIVPVMKEAKAIAASGVPVLINCHIARNDFRQGQPPACFFFFGGGWGGCWRQWRDQGVICCIVAIVSVVLINAVPFSFAAPPNSRLGRLHLCLSVSKSRYTAALEAPRSSPDVMRGLTHCLNAGRRAGEANLVVTFNHQTVSGLMMISGGKQEK